MNNNPIGVLDSGLGGLTVWKEIVALLPNESTVYIADSKNTPYGTKSPDEIYELAKKSIEFLLSKKAKIIVTACNAITVSCVDQLRATFPDVPIVGTVPAIKPAGERTKNKRIGIISTTRTAASNYQEDLIRRFAADCTIFSYGTDDLVPLIEKGEMKSEQMTTVLKQALAPFIKEHVDCLVLGCTHYPFLIDQMQEILGPRVMIIDSGEAIARRVNSILAEKDMSSGLKKAEHAFFTTGDADIATNLLQDTMGNKSMFFQKV